MAKEDKETLNELEKLLYTKVSNYLQKKQAFEEIEEKNAWSNVRLLEKYASLFHPENPNIYAELHRKKELTPEAVSADMWTSVMKSESEAVSTVYSSLPNLIDLCRKTIKSDTEIDGKAQEYAKLLLKLPPLHKELAPDLPKETLEILNKIAEVKALEQLPPHEIRKQLGYSPEARWFTDAQIKEFYITPLVITAKNYLITSLKEWIKYGKIESKKEEGKEEKE